MPTSAGLLTRYAETDDGAAVDDGALARLEAEVGQQGFTQLLRVLRKTLAERRAGLSDALRSDDGETMSHLAHTMKTSALYVGAARMAAACIALETAARDGAANVAELANELIYSSKRVSVALAARDAARWQPEH